MIVVAIGIATVTVVVIAVTIEWLTAPSSDVWVKKVIPEMHNAGHMA
jgi:hypothetical protein